MGNEKQDYGEPWEATEDHKIIQHGCCFDAAIVNRDGSKTRNRICECLSMKDAVRIAACVSALKGIPSETLKHFGNSGIWNFEKVDGMQMFSLTINGGSRLPDIDLNEFNEEAPDE